MKPRQIAFIVDGDFEKANPELTQQVADHFVEWMSSPPVVFFRTTSGFPKGEIPMLNKLAGELDDADRKALARGLPRLIAIFEDGDLWELAANRLSS